MSPQGNGTAKGCFADITDFVSATIRNHVDNKSPLVTGYTHLTGGYDGGQAQYNRVPYGE